MFAGARQILCRSIRPAEPIRRNQAYIRMQYVFWVRTDIPKPWDLQLPNYGTLGKFSNGKYYPYYNGNERMNEPVALGNDGRPINTDLKLYIRGASPDPSFAPAAHTRNTDQVPFITYANGNGAGYLTYEIPAVADFASLALVL